MVALTVDQVIQASSRKRAGKVKKVTLEGIGDVYLVPISAADQTRLGAATNINAADYIAAAWADENGTRIEVTPEQVTKLAADLDPDDVELLLNETYRVSKLQTTLDFDIEAMIFKHAIDNESAESLRQFAKDWLEEQEAAKKKN